MSYTIPLANRLLFHKIQFNLAPGLPPLSSPLPGISMQTAESANTFDRQDDFPTQKYYKGAACILIAAFRLLPICSALSFVNHHGYL